MKPLQIYNKLLKHFGKQYWWPAETRFEVIIGAFLTQQTNWKNVELAIKNLKNKKHLLASCFIYHSFTVSLLLKAKIDKLLGLKL